MKTVRIRVNVSGVRVLMKSRKESNETINAHAIQRLVRKNGLTNVDGYTINTTKRPRNTDETNERLFRSEN